MPYGEDMNGTLIVNGESMNVHVVRTSNGWRVLDDRDGACITLEYLEYETQREHGANAIPRIELQLPPCEAVDALVADGWPVTELPQS